MNAPEAKAARPRTIAELDTLAGSTVTYVAGATDLMARPGAWNAIPHLVDVTSVADLANTLRGEAGGLLIGAALPISRFIHDPRVIAEYPLLVEACRQIGSVQIQNRATLGGNIANASPAGDSLPVLAVYDAELWLGPRGAEGFQRVKLSDIFAGPGRTTLGGRYLAFIHLPKLPGGKPFGSFRKVGQRYSLAISKLSLAVLAWSMDGRIREIRICAGSVSPTVRRAAETEALLSGKVLTDSLIAHAAKSLAAEVAPISDIRSSEVYRRHICGAVLADALHRLQHA